MAAIVITVLATAATVATLGVLGVPAMSAAGFAISVLFAAAGGAVANMASQGVMIAGGMQEDMNWNEVATGAISGAVTAGVGMAIGAAARSAVMVARNARAVALATSAAEQGGDDALNAARYVQNLQRTMPRTARLLEKHNGKLVKLFGASNHTEKAAIGMKATGVQKALIKARTSLVDTAIGTADGVVSEMVSQGLNVASGLSDKFDWNQVWMSTLNPGSPGSAGLSASGAKLGAMADAETELLRSMGRMTPTKASLANASAFKRFKSSASGKVLLSTGQFLALGFGMGVAKSSIYQGIGMATGDAQEFDVNAMLMLGAASGVATGMNKGLVEIGTQRVDSSTARMDTRNFDWQRIGAATVSSVASNFVLNANDLVATKEFMSTAQTSLVSNAAMLGAVRMGSTI